MCRLIGKSADLAKHPLPMARLPGRGMVTACVPEQGVCEPCGELRRRSAWSSTFMASLELARQGDVALGQGRDFAPIHVARR
jgi:chromatin segregation and condensation protein Rec8/ScpA/Scc1 (kleisin family)